VENFYFPLAYLFYLLSASQPIPLAHTDSQTRLHDSVHQVFPQVQRWPVCLSGKQRCPCPASRDCGPAVEGRNRACPSSRTQDSGELQPILDLRVLNRALYKLKMPTQKHILMCVRSQDWFAAIDLKDAYFYVSSLLRQTVTTLSFKGLRILV